MASPRFVAKLLRRKALVADETPLQRTLGLISLTALGVGATLGSGVYVLWGVVAKNTTGPAVVLSFAIAAVASVLSGLCYAEMASRVPRAGSAYVYAYVTVGELLAWSTAWQLLLEYILGASAVAVSLSGYIDSLSGGRIHAFVAGLPGGTWGVPGLASTPDVLAAVLTMVFTLVVALGVRESTRLNNALTAVNIAVIIFVLIAGCFFVKAAYFVPFAPNGFSSVVSGAATLFFCFVGFDVIATTAEEALNPSRTVPAAIVVSLAVCTLAYVGVAGVVTLMVSAPLLDTNAPLASAFRTVGAGWASSIIEVGAIAGLTTSLMTCVFPMPRIIYAIAADGLLPAWLGAVHPRTGTPVVATMLAGSLAAALALIFDINALAEMMSIGTLLAYTIVCASVLVLRFRDYEEREVGVGEGGKEGEGLEGLGEDGGSDVQGEDENESMPLTGGRVGGGGRTGGVRYSLSEGSPLEESLCTGTRGPRGGFRLWGMRPYAAACTCLGVFTLGVAGASAASVVLSAGARSAAASGALITLAIAGLTLALGAAVVLTRVPSSLPRGLDFVVPWCPWLPLAAVAVNVYLMASLSPTTWVRFTVWCGIGCAIYFGYGMRHSRAGAGA